MSQVQHEHFNLEATVSGGIAVADTASRSLTEGKTYYYQLVAGKNGKVIFRGSMGSFIAPPSGNNIPIK